MRSYRIDKKVTDADAQEKRFTDVLISEVFLLSLIFTYEGTEQNHDCCISLDPTKLIEITTSEYRLTGGRVKTCSQGTNEYL